MELKSPNDHRLYRYLVLPNQLRVLLIEDNKCDKSAAALAVNTGHFDDPIERQGDMAHLLEHMPFLVLLNLSRGWGIPEFHQSAWRQ